MDIDIDIDIDNPNADQIVVLDKGTRLIPPHPPGLYLYPPPIPLVSPCAEPIPPRRLL